MATPAATSDGGGRADAAFKPPTGLSAMSETPTRATEGTVGGIACSHCGLPVPAGLVEPTAEHQFCCSGCRVAYQVIRGAGLEQYYAIRARIDAPGRPALGSGRHYREFDDPAFLELYGRTTPAGLATIELYLEGVHCAACLWLVERTPLVVPGVASCRLDIGRSLATVVWDPAATRLSEVAAFLDSLGYPAHPYQGVERRDLERRSDRAFLIRIAVAGAVAGNIMLLAFALYGGAFHGIEAEFSRLFRWASLLLSLPSVLWCAGVFYRGAWGSLRTRTIHMDVPISVGILAGFGWGAANTVRGAGEIYFDSVTALIFLLLVGRFIQRRQQRSAARATELLFSLAPSTARLVEDGTVREVPVAALRPGAVVELRAGDSVPADGVVIQSSSTLDLSLLTGEARPVEVAPGSPAHAGTVNLASRILLEVRSTGEDTRVGRLLRLIEESARRRAPVVQLADRISGWFVAAVLALALATLLIWLRLDPVHAVDHAVALLIVSCPCALGLATPLAVAAAIGHAARRGILIKGGDALELLAQRGRMVLDKTGTLTEGTLAVVRWTGDQGLRPVVAAIEAHSSHPVAIALAAGSAVTGEQAVVDVVSHPGRGMTASWNGRPVLVGSPGFAASQGIAALGLWQPTIEAAVAEGLTPVVVSVNGTVAAVAALGDPIRADARRTLDRIGQMGWTVEVLSGDHSGSVATVMRQLGIEHGRGGADPETKAELVREAGATGLVAMAGDGINDAAALAAAAVGIGVHGGAEATLAAADVYLARPGLAPIAELLEGSRRTMRVIRRNLAFSLLYNAAAVSLAVAGVMHPALAAVLMPASSITVVLSSYRARTF
jgi:Cu2+-exporting ATPase